MRYEIAKNTIANVNDNISVALRTLVDIDAITDDRLAIDARLTRVALLLDITQKKLSAGLVVVPNGDDEDLFSDIEEVVIT